MAKTLVLILTTGMLAIYPSETGVIMADKTLSTGNSIESTFLQSSPRAYIAKKSPSVTVWITAYSSTPEETDDTPFITASGSTVRDGIIAANFLPFGTKVQIPSLFGDKIFIVEDRMHSRKTNNVDIWMPTKFDAIQFGAHRTEIAVLR
ncbi:MAG: 3D domain-containing protein [Patescibacteria group bacterium]|nr:3D domain-containing protein [Patescibacteria group bacterium]